MSEEVKELDPKEVEAQMLASEQAKAERADPVEIASMLLTLYTPRYCALVDKLSSRQLKRLTKSLVEFPLGKPYNHTDKLEAEAFHIGKNLMDAKMVLIYNVYNSRQEEIINKAAEAAGKEEGQTNNG